MDIVTHANTIPWLIDAQGFMTLMSYLIGAVVISTISGLLYAGLYRLLRNHNSLEDQQPDQLTGPTLSDDMTRREEGSSQYRQHISDEQRARFVTDHSQEKIFHEA